MKNQYGIIYKSIMQMDISPYSKLVYALLATYADEKKECWS
ncbi:unnamed protein product, partial [marine sediment metagenome]